MSDITPEEARIAAEIVAVWDAEEKGQASIDWVPPRWEIRGEKGARSVYQGGQIIIKETSEGYQFIDSTLLDYIVRIINKTQGRTERL